MEQHHFSFSSILTWYVTTKNMDDILGGQSIDRKHFSIQYNIDHQHGVYKICKGSLWKS